MKKTILFMAITVLTIAGIAAASIPPWDGTGSYTFDNTDPYFTEGSITDSATVDITGGSFGALHCYLASTVDMSAGTANRIWAYNSSDINLRGGDIGSVAGFDDAVIKLHVDSYSINTNTYIGYDASIEGVWLNNSGSFSLLVREGSLPHIQFVPEPVGIMLMAFGIISVRLRKTR